MTAVAYGKKLGKTVIVVNDGPGFYTTRTLSAYMNEAGRLLDEGASIEAIDRALVDFGFPVGPITLLDEVGIDVGGKVGQVLAEAFGARMAPSEAMRRVVAAGRTGRKGGKGFYRYDERGKKGARRRDRSTSSSAASGARFATDEIVQRCVLAMVNEAARCLEEGILRSPRDGDVGAVFGIGFPPFRGGPFRYVDSVSAPTDRRTAGGAEHSFSRHDSSRPRCCSRRHGRDADVLSIGSAEQWNGVDIGDCSTA